FRTSSFAFLAGPIGFSLSDKRTSEECDDFALADAGKCGRPPSMTVLAANHSRLLIVCRLLMNWILGQQLPSLPHSRGHGAHSPGNRVPPHCYVGILECPAIISAVIFPARKR